MRGSQLDRRITIERPGTVDGEYGPQPDGWVLVAARVPAQVQAIQPSKSTEMVEHGLEMATLSARLRIRYMRGITSDMRVIVHGEADAIYQITAGPAELGRREWLEMRIEQYSS